MASVVNGIHGLRDIVKKLEGLPPKVETRVVKVALYAGAVVIRDLARSRVPVNTGALKSRIIAKSKPIRRGVFWASAGVAKGEFTTGRRAGRQPRRYAHLVEFGTAHSAAQPFIRPAADREEEIFAEIIAKAKARFEESLRDL